MAFLMIYPAVAVLTLFVLMVIMLILRFGEQCSNKLPLFLRGRCHTTTGAQDYWDEDEAYEQKVSYA